MLNGIMLLWFTLTGLSVFFVALDIRSTPESPVLKWAFVLLTAYTGPVGAFFYVLGCREPLRESHEQPTEPLAVFPLEGEGAFSKGPVQIAWALDEGRGFILFSANSEIWNPPRRRRARRRVGMVGKRSCASGVARPRNVRTTYEKALLLEAGRATL